MGCRVHAPVTNNGEGFGIDVVVCSIELFLGDPPELDANANCHMAYVNHQDGKGKDDTNH